MVSLNKERYINTLREMCLFFFVIIQRDFIKFGIGCCAGQSSMISFVYRGADKSLARPGRKQATATEDFEFHIS